MPLTHPNPHWTVERARAANIPILGDTELFYREKVASYRDLPEITVRQIEHFFSRYEDLEPGKWVRIGHWGGVEEAKRLIVEAIARTAKGD